MSKNSLSKELIKILIGTYKKQSYGQEAEDLVLARLFGINKRDGFYVDIGAHHPIRFSNTYRFYKKGWKGINVDAFPGSMKLFKIFRSRDTNIESPITKVPGEMEYYMFKHHAINTLSKEVADKRVEAGEKLMKTVKLKTQTLENILDNHLPEGKEIDFLTVDVEGLDLEVLQSNNWDKYKPKVIVAESLDTSLLDLAKDPIYEYLTPMGYTPLAKLYNSVIYTRE